MSLLVISLARSLRFGEKVRPWFGGSSILASSHDTFFMREMRPETSMFQHGTFRSEIERGKTVKWGGRSVEERVEGVDRIGGLVASLGER